jgi:hypothetical protein
MIFCLKKSTTTMMYFFLDLKYDTVYNNFKNLKILSVYKIYKPWFKFFFFDGNRDLSYNHYLLLSPKTKTFIYSSLLLFVSKKKKLLSLTQKKWRRRNLMLLRSSICSLNLFIALDLNVHRIEKQTNLSFWYCWEWMEHRVETMMVKTKDTVEKKSSVERLW